MLSKNIEDKREMPPERKDPYEGERGIILDGVTKTYSNGFEAVHPTYLKIEQGEFFSLLGSSGSGKTTMLKMLSGLEFATTGIIRLDGKIITNVPANKRDVHTVFQNYALFPHMSVKKNIAYGLEGRRIPKDDIAKRVERMIDLVELGGHKNDKPGELSGGMQQRVALARALVLEPRALLLDEPLGALDLKLRHHMQEVLKDIHQKVGITFVYVTHDQEEAFSMSDRIGVMTSGMLEQVSTPYQLYTQPKTRFVATFVGASNIFEGVIEEAIDRPAGIYRVRFDVTGKSYVVKGTSYMIAGARVSGVVRPQMVWVSLPEDAPSGDSDSVMTVPVQIVSQTFLGGYNKIAAKAGEQEILSHAFTVDPSISGAQAAVASWDTKDIWIVR